MTERVITALSPEQRAALDAAAQDALALVLETAPADFETAEAAIARLYAASGRPRPHFVRVASPLAAELCVHVIDAIGRSAATGPQWEALIAGLLGAPFDARGGRSPITTFRDTHSDDAQRAFKTPVSQDVWDAICDAMETPRSRAGQLQGEIENEVVDALNAPHTIPHRLFRAQWAALTPECLGPKRLSHIGTKFWGQHAIRWEPIARRLLGHAPKDLELYWDDIEAVNRSIGWWRPFEGYCVLMDRPERIVFDERGRFHCDAGPVVRFRDGFSVYAIDGVRVPRQVVEAPETLTAEQVRAELNAEVRRVMLDRYGGLRGSEAAGKWLTDLGVKPIDVDPVHGALYRRDFAADEALVMLRVTCPSSGRVYFLRVPPNMRTAREARAWTFGKDPATFAPEAET